MVIYKITNLLNGKIYIGQTKQPIEKRFLQHSKANSPLGQAMRQCGLENFIIEIIERCENQEQMNEREKFWIKVLNSLVPNGYNILNGGTGFFSTKIGRKSSAKTFEGYVKVRETDIARFAECCRIAKGGWNTKQCAEKYRCSEATVSNIMNGKQKSVSSEILQAILYNINPSADITKEQILEAYGMAENEVLSLSGANSLKMERKTLLEYKEFSIEVISKIMLRIAPTVAFRDDYKFVSSLSEMPFDFAFEPETTPKQRDLWFFAVRQGTGAYVSCERFFETLFFNLYAKFKTKKNIKFSLIVFDKKLFDDLTKCYMSALVSDYISIVLLDKEKHLVSQEFIFKRRGETQATKSVLVC